MTDQAMQTRCPNCLREQYILNVVDFSNGAIGCHVCGKKTQPMTYEQWFDALRERRGGQR